MVAKDDKRSGVFVAKSFADVERIRKTFAGLLVFEFHTSTAKKYLENTEMFVELANKYAKERVMFVRFSADWFKDKAENVVTSFPSYGFHIPGKWFVHTIISEEIAKESGYDHLATAVLYRLTQKIEQFLDST